ncbi:enolase C-terminal domain-like protein [Arsukibacterium sp.]|uniref:enolase C-terminal domain-like protein n=1 Tax=Arsukibacterium sp. TaxID=1977258 RepID=UPI0026304371|nr:enolase C-terminal domain-like protein [Arsukibacterium sp.]
MRAADIINIKLMKTGGIANAIKIADICSFYDMQCMIGCMLEGSISVAAAVHVAVAKSDVITKIDLDGPSLCALIRCKAVSALMMLTLPLAMRRGWGSPLSMV